MTCFVSINANAAPLITPLIDSNEFFILTNEKTLKANEHRSTILSKLYKTDGF
jgi:hypothetical protein